MVRFSGQAQIKQKLYELWRLRNKAPFNLMIKAKKGEIWMNKEMGPLVLGNIEKPVRVENEIRLKGKEITISALVFKPLHY